MTRNLLNKGEKELVDWPSFAWIALTNRCNLSCKHCQREYLERQGLMQPQEISWEVFTKLETEVFPHLQRIQLGGNNFGEQLMASNWDRFFGKLREYKLGISLVSNSTLVNPERIKALVEVGAELNFSLEGTTESSYEAVRGWKFERFLSVVREACREKKRNPSTGARVNLGFTAFRDNISELPDLLKMASHLGIDRVTVTHFVPWQENQRGKSLVYHRNIANEMIEKASFLSKEFDLLVDLPKPFREDEAQTKADISKGEVWVRKPCYHPWRSFSINEKGEVMPCCATSVVMGNLEKSSFLEIWNGPKYRKLRKTVNSSQPLSFCGNCGLRGIEVGSSAPLSFYSDENILLAVIGPTNHVRTFTSILRRVKDSLYKVRWGRKLLPCLVEFHRQHGAFSSLEAYSDGFISLLNKGVTSLRKRKGLQS